MMARAVVPAAAVAVVVVEARAVFEARAVVITGSVIPLKATGLRRTSWAVLRIGPLLLRCLRCIAAIRWALRRSAMVAALIPALIPALFPALFAAQFPPLIDTLIRPGAGALVKTLAGPLIGPWPAA